LSAAILVVLSVVGSSLGANVVETLTAEPTASTLVALINQAGLASALTSSDVTVFAPTDAAFAKVPAATLAALQGNATALANLLKYHVVSGTVGSSSITDDMLAPSLAGSDIRLNLYPHNSLVTANGAVISSPDHAADNGMIHYIDSVIMPPTMDMYDTLKNDPKYSTLMTALATAGLPGHLSGSHTIFAPTNDAFAKLAPSDLDKLLKESPPIHLVNLLEYHVLDHVVFSEGLFNHEYEGTIDVAHDRVHIRVTADGVMVNNAKVTAADHLATNGVLHEIDHVLVPVRVGFWLRTGHGGVGK